MFVLWYTSTLLITTEAYGDINTSYEPPQPVGQHGQWKLIFSDDFESASLDLHKWATCYWWGIDGCSIITNKELQWYQADDVFLHNGALKLRGRKRRVIAQSANISNFTIYDYTSGVVTTGRNSPDKSRPAKFAFKYGYAEIKTKLPRGRGLWPAFWLLPENHKSKPEIDIMEVYGDKPDTVEFNFHYLNHKGRPDKESSTWKGPDFSTGYHIFAVDWQPDSIVWYVDGVERWRYEEEHHIPDMPMYLLLNLAIGGIGPGPPDESTLFPAHYEIRYVRVWRRIAEGEGR